MSEVSSLTLTEYRRNIQKSFVRDEIGRVLGSYNETKDSKHSEKKNQHVVVIHESVKWGIIIQKSEVV